MLGKNWPIGQCSISYTHNKVLWERRHLSWAFSADMRLLKVFLPYSGVAPMYRVCARALPPTILAHEQACPVNADANGRDLSFKSWHLIAPLLLLQHRALLPPHLQLFARKLLPPPDCG